MPTTLEIILICNLRTNNSPTTRIRRRAAVTSTINYFLRKVKAEIFQGQVKVIFFNSNMVFYTVPNSGQIRRFWASRIRLLPSTSKKIKKNLDFNCYLTINFED